MPAVSVIIPVYNVEPYIARCARSLFGQTLQDLEYIFVDDCTPDRSMQIVMEVLEEYQQWKAHVKIVKTPMNGGLARARLAGVAVATGDYIIHCDSDDEVETDAYRQMYEKAIAEDLDIVTCNFQLLGLKKQRIQSQVSLPGREIADILSGKVYGTVWCRMCRRGIWNDIMLPKGGDMWEDVVFSVQTISRAARIGYVTTPLYIYYRRESSMCFEEGLSAALKRWSSQCVNIQQVLDFISRKDSVRVELGDIVMFKYRARYPLFPYVQIPDCYQKWRETFPEIDAMFLGTKGISLEIKFWFVLIHLHLYYPWKCFTGLFRKVFA